MEQKNERMIQIIKITKQNELTAPQTGSSVVAGPGTTMTADKGMQRQKGTEAVGVLREG